MSQNVDKALKYTYRYFNANDDYVCEPCKEAKKQLHDEPPLTPNPDCEHDCRCFVVLNVDVIYEELGARS